MKSHLFLAILFSLGFFINANAQKKSVEERVSAVHTIFENNLGLAGDKLTQLDNIFTEFYSAQQQIRENLQAPRATGGMMSGFAPHQQDFQSVRQKNDKLITDRDNKLRKLLAADQYKKWKEEVEPALRKR